MTTTATVVLEVVSASGTAAWRDAGGGYSTFQATPPSSFGDSIGGSIPITLDHGGRVLGFVDFAEYGLDFGGGAMVAVGVIDLPAESIDGTMFCSAEIRCDALATTVDGFEWEPRTASTWRMRPTATTVGRLTATESHLDGLALVPRTASIAASPCRAWPGDYRRGRLTGLPPIIGRAATAATSALYYRSGRPARLPIHHPGVNLVDTGGEYHRGGRPEVSHHGGGYVIGTR